MLIVLQNIKHWRASESDRGTIQNSEVQVREALTLDDSKMLYMAT
jgi:hypothetical protein